MDDAYLEFQDMVHFTIQSNFGINEKIMLPLPLVKDLQEHMDAFDGVVKYPFNSVILHALFCYLDYINCELIRFDNIKQFLDELSVDVQQEMMVVESDG